MIFKQILGLKVLSTTAVIVIRKGLFGVGDCVLNEAIVEIGDSSIHLTYNYNRRLKSQISK
jgi:hypothetical protein